MDPNLANAGGSENKSSTTTNHDAPTGPGPTFGEKAVGIKFNPSEKQEVSQIKRLCAATIDELYQQSLKTTDGEEIAMFKLAIRKIQEGQMWGVKAATWNL